MTSDLERPISRAARRVVRATLAALTVTVLLPYIDASPARAATTGNVGRSGRQLTLNGVGYRFTGLNAYHLTTDYSINYGCGQNNTQADLDAFFSSLRPNSMVRTWAFQGLAWDKRTNTQTFATIDRVVNTASRYGQRVVLVVGNQWSSCDQSYKTEAWYQGGYRQPLSDGTALGKQLNPLSYWEYLRRIVSRYATSPAIGMWELLNEPAPQVASGGTCSSTASGTLRSFFDTVGGEVKRLDPNHLISSGVQGSGQCGARNSEYVTVHQSPGIDVASFHDYWQTMAMPGDPWNGLQVRLNQMATVNKPLYVGEAGINASDTVIGVPTLAQRRDMFKLKMDVQFAAGIVGFTPWMWSRTANAYNFSIAPGDPTLTLLKSYPL